MLLYSLKRLVLIYSLIVTLIIMVNGAPRSRSKNQQQQQPQTVFDQKQTGDYNIQLHLKDFQIIALLGDESLGSLGDYDYNYDYTDFTVKPPGANNITLKPPPLSSGSSSWSIVPGASTTTTAANLSPSTVKPSSSSLTGAEDAIKPLDAAVTIPPSSSSLSSSLSTPLLITNNKKDDEPAIAITTTESSAANNNSHQQQLDKINVQILRAPSSSNITPNAGAALVPISDDLAGEAGGVATASLDANSQTALGEIMYYRRCLNGFSRDKKGRCKRVRRPANAGGQLSFDFTRLASNLASRLRQSSSSSSDLSSMSGSESF